MVTNDNFIVNDLDWYKSKTITIPKKGSMALATSFFVKKEEVAVKVKQRYVWPSSSGAGETKTITKRIWGSNI